MVIFGRAMNDYQDQANTFSAPRTADARSTRRLRTRAALLQAGADLLWRRPIDAIPINDITEAAGVAKGSFFNHFADKAAFAEAVAESIRADVERRVRAANDGLEDPALRAARALCVFIRFAQDEPQKAKILLRGYAGMTDARHPLNSGLSADIRQGVQTGRFAPETETAGVLFVSGVAFLAMVRAAQTAAGGHDRDNCRSLLMLTLSGLGVTRAEARRVAGLAVDSVLHRETGS
jgi:AcrR family transcriptional regulator